MDLGLAACCRCVSHFGACQPIPFGWPRLSSLLEADIILNASWGLRHSLVNVAATHSTSEHSVIIACTLSLLDNILELQLRLSGGSQAVEVPSGRSLNCSAKLFSTATK